MQKISSKDADFRERALNGNMWKLLLAVGMPLAMHQGLSSMFKILDALMASHISAESVSTVAYLAQIQQMISAIGTGLAAGGSMKISEAYGAGDYEMVKKRVNSLFAICGGLCVLVLLMIPFSKQILMLANTPENLLIEGQQYFAVELGALVLTFFNTVYISVERSRGHSKRILKLNLSMTILKLGLTALFVYGFNMGIVMIGVATVISQAVITIAGFYNLREKDTAFSIDRKQMSMKKEVVLPIINVAYPVSIEKVAFAFGKVVVNSMSGFYGALTVGALGISNNISGLTTSWQIGMQDGAASIISQNLGAGKLKRVKEAFWKTMIINVGIGLTGMLISFTFLEQISALFAKSQGGFNEEFQQMIMHIFVYDSSGSAVPLAINASVMALLFGLGYTKRTLIINFMRIFIYRIPVLWALQNFTELGSEAVGVMMMISNICTAATALIMAFLVLRKLDGMVEEENKLR